MASRIVWARSLLASMVAAGLVGCVFTLPFDKLTEGAPADAAFGDASSSPPSPEGGPFSHYAFEEGSGTSAGDSVGTNPGVLSEYDGGLPTWTPSGKKGGAIDFSLADGWIHFPTLSASGFPRRATIAAWVRIKEYDAEGNGLIDVEEQASAGDNEIPMTLSLEPGAVFFHLQVGEGPSGLMTGPAVPLDTWALVAVGWDLATSDAFLFVRIDGRPPHPVQRGRVPEGFAIESPGLSVAASGGRLDELRMWSRLLGEDELRALD